MKKFWNRHLSTVAPYVPGEQPKDKQYCKLNTNESPYPPSPLVEKRLREAAVADMRLYPDPDTLDLRNLLAQEYGLQPQNIFTGNGSDEVLAFSFMAYFNTGDKVYYPDVSYSFYPVYADLFGIKGQAIPLDPDFQIRTADYADLDGGIIIPNPNAPTGILLGVEQVERIVSRNPGQLVVIDEAYIDFGGQSAVQLINRYDNLLVVHTFSKSRALAGMRLGYAMGHSNLIQALECVKFSFNSYTVNRLTMIAGQAALEDKAYFDRTCQAVIATRTRVTADLVQLGFNVLPSSANFIFAAHPSITGEALYAMLRNEGVLVRHFKNPRIENFIRITIGTDAEMDRFVEIVTKSCVMH